MEVITLNPEYPCCGRRARFSGDDFTNEAVVRMCPGCGTRWTIHRVTVDTSEAGTSRLDSIQWTPLIGG